MAKKSLEQLRKEWRSYVRAYLIKLVEKRNHPFVSMNDVHAAMQLGPERGGIEPAPGDVGEFRRGDAAGSLFTENDAWMFHNTGRHILSTATHSKRRAIILWEYIPELDTRGESACRGAGWASDPRQWC